MLDAQHLPNSPQLDARQKTDGNCRAVGTVLLSEPADAFPSWPSALPIAEGQALVIVVMELLRAGQPVAGAQAASALASPPLAFQGQAVDRRWTTEALLGHEAVLGSVPLGGVALPVHGRL